MFGFRPGVAFGRSILASHPPRSKVWIPPKPSTKRGMPPSQRQFSRSR